MCQALPDPGGGGDVGEHQTVLGSCCAVQVPKLASESHCWLKNAVDAWVTNEVAALQEQQGHLVSQCHQRDNKQEPGHYTPQQVRQLTLLMCTRKHCFILGESGYGKYVCPCFMLCFTKSLGLYRSFVWSELLHALFCWFE
jgi:hypothetical protein